MLPFELFVAFSKAANRHPRAGFHRELSTCARLYYRLAKRGNWMQYLRVYSNSDSALKFCARPSDSQVPNLELETFAIRFQVL